MAAHDDTRDRRPAIAGNLDRTTLDAASPPAPAPAAPASTATGAPPRFEEVGELGRGGMGRVVEAYDHTLGRTVALKQALDGADVAIARFEREARITARLEHPGIVPVHDLGHGPDGAPYYVMKRVHGEPLDALITGRPFAERLAHVSNLLAACEACAFAHAHRVIHRDIKPSNILVGAFGETLLIDWGLARALEDAADPARAIDGAAPDTAPRDPACAINGAAPVPGPRDPALTGAGRVAGTPGFMAPEQARGEPADARADVFALGATLFYVLAGAAPFPGEAPEVIERVRAGGAPAWSRLPAETPPDLRAIVEKATRPAPEDRYPDAGLLAADLRRFVTGQLVSAYTYRPWERLRRYVRRHRAAVAVAAVAAVTIAVGAVAAVRGILDERDEARRQRRAAVDRSDELLVRDALRLATTDPAAAIVRLRELPLASRQWEQASVVATIAALHGIPRGFTVRPTPPALVEVSPRGTRIAVISVRDREVELIEPFASGSRRRIRLPLAGAQTVPCWLDDRTLAVAAGRTVIVLDAVSLATRRLALPAEIAELVPDGGARRAWARTQDRQVFALDAAPVALGPTIAWDAGDIAHVGPGRLAIARTRSLELWDHGAVTRLRAETAGAVLGGAGRVAARFGDRWCTWSGRDPAAPPACHPADRRSPLALGVTSNALWMAGTDELLAWFDNGRELHRATAGYPDLASSGGDLVYVRPDGALVVIHADAPRVTVVAQPPATRYARTVVSADRRVLAALTTRGVLLVWDLSRLAAAHHAHDGMYLLGLEADRVVLAARGRPPRLARVDAAGRREVMEPATSLPVVQQSLAPDGTWVHLWTADAAARGMALRALFHLPSARLVELAPRERVVTSRDAAYALRDGVISALAPDGRRAPLAYLPGATGIDAAGGHLVVLAGERLCRLTPATGARACVRAGRPTTARIDPRGDVWVVSGASLARWARGSAVLEPVLPGVAVRSLRRVEDELVAVAAGSVTALWREPLRPIALPGSLAVIAGSKARLLAMDASFRQHHPSIIDVATGITFELPAPGLSDRGDVRGSRIALEHDRGVDVYQLAVPRERFALRAWLAAITNAEHVTGAAGVVEWP